MNNDALIIIGIVWMISLGFAWGVGYLDGREGEEEAQMKPFAEACISIAMAVCFLAICVCVASVILAPLGLKWLRGKV